MIINKTSTKDKFIYNLKIPGFESESRDVVIIIHFFEKGIVRGV